MGDRGCETSGTHLCVHLCVCVLACLCDCVCTCVCVYVLVYMYLCVCGECVYPQCRMLSWCVVCRNM